MTVLCQWSGGEFGVRGVEERGRCCGSYLLIDDTHTKRKQQTDRLANAETRSQNWRPGPETPVWAGDSDLGRRVRCRPETPVHRAGDSGVENLLVFLSRNSRLESSNPQKFGQN